jgi:hypothetical protein
VFTISVLYLQDNTILRQIGTQNEAACAGNAKQKLLVEKRASGRPQCCCTALCGQMQQMHPIVARFSVSSHAPRTHTCLTDFIGSTCDMQALVRLEVGGATNAYVLVVLYTALCCNGCTVCPTSQPA